MRSRNIHYYDMGTKLPLPIITIKWWTQLENDERILTRADFYETKKLLVTANFRMMNIGVVKQNMHFFFLAFHDSRQYLNFSFLFFLFLLLFSISINMQIKIKLNGSFYCNKKKCIFSRHRVKFVSYMKVTSTSVT